MEGAERAVLTALCTGLDALRAECAQWPESRRQLLARIEAEARARRPILHLVAQLLGTSQEETRQMTSGGLAGFGPGRADEESFGCPDRACDQVATTLPAGPLPRCVLTDTSMRRQ
ncbi:hypothetical protein HGA13_29775 [Nocardia speluncae]|uniref:Uncharacterized protein n=1 Tax=Nocardia speluncae TaxID=419477 RepID=A0A846XR34_9NOCA|nr:hypothetical protein [Nocardia speluncae]NKY37230.1 hypothetical protein [Nocardia speluncae]